MIEKSNTSEIFLMRSRNPPASLCTDFMAHAAPYARVATLKIGAKKGIPEPTRSTVLTNHGNAILTDSTTESKLLIASETSVNLRDVAYISLRGSVKSFKQSMVACRSPSVNKKKAHVHKFRGGGYGGKGGGKGGAEKKRTVKLGEETKKGQRKGKIKRKRARAQA